MRFSIEDFKKFDKNGLYRFANICCLLSGTYVGIKAENLLMGIVLSICLMLLSSILFGAVFFIKFIFSKPQFHEEKE
jgi:hypothetical protein